MNAFHVNVFTRAERARRMERRALQAEYQARGEPLPPELWAGGTDSETGDDSNESDLDEE